MKILISYRRSDTQAIAGRIHDHLRRRYGEDSTFMDIDNIPFGVDFRTHIKDALDGASALLVIIGARWLGDPQHQRILEETDFVRIEVETALRRNIPVVPVLIDGAEVPRSDQLPESLRELTFRNAAPVDSGRDFSGHMDRLIRSLDGLLGIKEHAARTPPPARSPPRVWLALSIGAGVVVVSLATWFYVAGRPSEQAAPGRITREFVPSAPPSKMDPSQFPNQMRKW